MFFSDEPGFYKDGEYGIRIESVLRVVNKVTYTKLILPAASAVSSISFLSSPFFEKAIHC